MLHIDVEHGYPFEGNPRTGSVEKVGLRKKLVVWTNRQKKNEKNVHQERKKVCLVIGPPPNPPGRSSELFSSDPI